MIILGEKDTLIGGPRVQGKEYPPPVVVPLPVGVKEMGVSSGRASSSNSASTHDLDLAVDQGN